jgi:hypothetical protein
MLHNNALDQKSFCRSRHLLFFAIFHNGANASAAPGSRVPPAQKDSAQRGVRQTKVQSGEIVYIV